MAIELEKVLPSEIEKRSFEIITEELTQSGIVLDPEKAPVIKRCIHTSADFDYAQNLVFSENAIARAKEAIRNGASIVTDTQMGRSGINKKRLSTGDRCTALCLMKMWQKKQSATVQLVR